MVVGKKNEKKHKEKTLNAKRGGGQSPDKREKGEEINRRAKRRLEKKSKVDG